VVLPSSSGRVYFDEQIFILQRGGGIPRYFAHLIEEMRAIATPSEFSVDPRFWISRTPYLDSLEFGRMSPEWLARPRILYPLNAPSRLLARKTAIVHQTYYHKFFLHLPKKSRRVTTIHDMIPEALPELFDTNPHLEKAEYVRRSDLILCVSEHTKRMLLQFIPDVQCPIEVTPLGVSRFWFETPRATEEVRGPYLLYVGSRAVYKDFQVLIEAMSQLSRDAPRLLVVGGGPPSSSEMQLMARLNVLDRIDFIGASDEELRSLYAGAQAFIYPSRHEGFGLPTLEAMAAGTVAVLSNASVFPEVGGATAMYFEAGDPDDLCRAILATLNEPAAARQSRLLGGRQRAQAFSWAETARLTAAAYDLIP
jgi:glycosyltransferase involved in cell wall biosynthesis